MKKSFYFSILFTFILASCTHKKKEEAVLYNDAIVHEVSKADSLIQLVFTFEMFDQYPLFKESFLFTLQSAKQNLESTKPFQGDDSLRVSAIELVNTYSDIINVDYAGIYDIMKDSVYSIADSIKVDSFMNMMNQKWETESKKISLIQKRFAERTEISLTK